MQILDGKSLSGKLKDDILAASSSHKKVPILAVITVGDDSSSEVYVRNKKKACEYVGSSFMHFSYPSDTKESIIIKKIKELNKDDTVNGMILQLPIPRHFNTEKIINTINPIKDVDGLTNVSMGKLMNKNYDLIPCTPKGIMEIFKHYNIELEGKNVCVVGRSSLVGKPISMLCNDKNATVTMCHSKTKNLKNFTSKADILIVAVGKKWLIDETMIKKDAVIIDVGINSENGKLYGDVNPNVESKCSMMTPVPGGVGPMTIAMLMHNVVKAAKQQ
jgi:methylenetetrahydrofolate dehydrogenase (NADP+)/methenyltetrahydrofolate cyclohydrolase